MSANKRKKKDEGSDRASWEKEYLKQCEQLDEANKELEEMVLKNRKLERQLKDANDKRLRSDSMLSTRGVIEWLEEKQRMPDSVRRGVRHDRWRWIFENVSTFSNEVRSYFPRSNAERVAKILTRFSAMLSPIHNHLM